MAQEIKVNSEDNECQICYEKYTSQLRKQIECHACFQKCCSTCVTYYLLNTTGNATCMFKNCNKTWSDNYIFETLGKTIYSKFRDFKLEQVFQKEKSLIPKTQIKIQNQKEAELISKRIRSTEQMMFHFDYMFRICDSLKKYNKFCNEYPLINTNNELVLRKQFSDFSKEIVLLNERKNKLLSGSNKDKLKFIRNCGKTTCKGLLSTKWICGTCKTKYCKHCGEEKGIANDSEIIDNEDNEEKEEMTTTIDETKSGHICDPNLVETMKSIQKETKSCPKCGINIFKIEGCNQMWCINCHTAFDWNTRRIEAGRIHNPHYYDWQRKINNGTAPRVVGDIPLCQQIPPFFNNPLKYRYLDDGTLSSLEDFYRFVVEVDEIYNTNNFRDIGENTFEIHREQLISNIYPSEKQYKTNLKKAFNKFEKNAETHQIFMTFKTIITEALNDLNSTTTEKHMFELVDTIHNIIEFTNDNLYKLSLKYSTSVYDKIENRKYKNALGMDEYRWNIKSTKKTK